MAKNILTNYKQTYKTNGKKDTSPMHKIQTIIQAKHWIE